MKQKLVKPQKHETELIVFIKAKQLTEYITRISAVAPVKYRYSLLNRLLGECYDMLHLLFEANELDLKDINRIKLIRKAIARLKTIDFVSTFAIDVKCFTKKQGEVITMYSGDCYKYLLGYYNHSKSALVIK